MYARTTIVRGDPNAMADGITHIRETVWPMIQDMSGCVGMSMLADRENGRCIMTTAWADETAMHASAEPMVESRRQAAEVLRAEAVEVAEWEIAGLHRLMPASDAACTRVIWSDVDSADADGMLETFRMSLLPRLEALPGFCSVSMLVDRSTGHAVAAVTYTDREALSQSRDQAMALREEFGQAMGVQVTEVAEFELAMAHLRVPEMA